MAKRAGDDDMFDGELEKLLADTVHKTGLTGTVHLYTVQFLIYHRTTVQFGQKPRLNENWLVAVG